MRLPNGRRTVHDLIGAADGYKMIEYMTTTHGGDEMGKMLSNAPHGADFNAATSRIYTANQLLAEIKKNYQQSATGKSCALRHNLQPAYAFDHDRSQGVFSAWPTVCTCT